MAADWGGKIAQRVKYPMASCNPQALLHQLWETQSVAHSLSSKATRGGEGIATWRALSEAAAVVRPILGISPSAWAEACEVMGHDNASITVAAILQRAEAIRSPGAYLRHLTQRARANQFSLGPVIMALLRAEARKEPKHAQPTVESTLAEPKL
jgi:hypothetical protein